MISNDVLNIRFIYYFLKKKSMEKGTAFLTDWAIRFLKNKDSIKRSIEEIKENEKNGFFIHYKDGTVRTFLVQEKLDETLIDKINAEKSVGLFALNNRNNINFLISKWDYFSSRNSLVIYFINPFSKKDKSWVINPYVHSKICDKASLKLGITSMAEMVDPIDEEKLIESID